MQEEWSKEKHSQDRDIRKLLSLCLLMQRASGACTARTLSLAAKKVDAGWGASDLLLPLPAAAQLMPCSNANTKSSSSTGASCLPARTAGSASAPCCRRLAADCTARSSAASV